MKAHEAWFTANGVWNNQDSSGGTVKEADLKSSMKKSTTDTQVQEIIQLATSKTLRTDLQGGFGRVAFSEAIGLGRV